MKRGANFNVMSKLIEIKGLVKEFPIKSGFFNKKVGAIHAVNSINLDIFKGETLGLVGESGCGKSTTGRCVIGLVPPSGGTVSFDGIDVTSLKGNDFKKLRKRMQIIFQNPYSSLNPRMTVMESLKEPLIVHKTLPKNKMNDRVFELLDMVGLPKDSVGRYPHEFSGGQRQRVGIARALALNPEFIVADEPVSALDVSIQAQIVNLLQDLKKNLGLTYLFISHDLSVVRHVSDRVAVMYLGEIVEIARTEDLFTNPGHPYTKALLSAVPVPDPTADGAKKIVLKGDIPSPSNPPSGCKFHTRCSMSADVCENSAPEVKEIYQGHFVNCHFI